MNATKKVRPATVITEGEEAAANATAGSLLNRELSMLAFNRRVLAQAEDTSSLHGDIGLESGRIF